MKYFKTYTEFAKCYKNDIEYVRKYNPYELTAEGLIRFNMNVIDHEMLQRGRPYYQIYPEVFDAVSNTTLELDIDDWKVPFDVFEIRMPKTDKPLIPVQPNSSLGVMSIQVLRNCCSKFGVLANTNEGKVALTYEYVKRNCPELVEMFTERSNDTAVKLNLCDYNDPTNSIKYENIMTTIIYRPDTRIELLVGETIQRLVNKESFVTDEWGCSDVSGCAWNKSLKLALGVSLLATGSHRIVEYDVLAKQLEAYQEMRAKGDKPGCKKMEKAARKKGKFGWNIGRPTERRLPLSQGESYGNGEHKGGHHSRASFRCGHWHKYRMGKSRSQVKIKWLAPTIVRPDLPFRKSA